MAHWHAKLVDFGFWYSKLLFGDGLVATQWGCILADCSGVSGVSSLLSAFGWGSSVCSWTSRPLESVVHISLAEFPLEKTLRLGKGSAASSDSLLTGDIDVDDAGSFVSVASPGRAGIVNGAQQVCSPAL